MGSIEALCRSYERFIALPWNGRLAGPQRVLFCVYDPRDERRLRARLGEFEVATKRRGHGWTTFDATDAFARWMAGHEYRDSYFESPEDLDLALQDFSDSVEESLRKAVGESPEAVVGLVGAGSLFGLVRVSRLIESIAPSIAGRLLVFFPGERDGSNYRLLGARDGWNYLATPIQAEEPNP